MHPLTPRTRYRPPFPFTELFHRDYSALFIRFVSQPRSPQPSSVPSPYFVLHPRLRNRPPSPSPLPSSVLVSGTILHPRHLNHPPSSFSALFTGFVSVAVLHSRFQPPCFLGMLLKTCANNRFFKQSCFFSSFKITDYISGL